MKKALLLFALLLFTVGCGNEDSESGGGTVYICTGSGDYAYHSNSSCSVLNNCQAEIVSINLNEAKKKRSACNICYK